MAILEGQPAPGFSLPDKDGNQISLVGLKGKNVVVYFYPKDDTPGCTKQAQGFRDLNPQFEALPQCAQNIHPIFQV